MQCGGEGGREHKEKGVPQVGARGGGRWRTCSYGNTAKMKVIESRGAVTHFRTQVVHMQSRKGRIQLPESARVSNRHS